MYVESSPGICLTHVIALDLIMMIFVMLISSIPALLHSHMCKVAVVF